MEDKEKQIEKMAELIDNRLIEARGYLGSMNKGEGYWIAQKLIEYYQPKLPENAVVLTQDEWNDESHLAQRLGYDLGRKETVEKILDLLVPDCKACDENWHSGCLCLRATLAEKIAKQLDIEIKE